ncbi:ferredoxin [Actinoplanes awajinensis]|uniref:Ferredoxin n=1 Tax=Actinoplanes awajinensis subsp. mycoplanecinus TaxID=135947 RepID=A0A101JC90_9ACTN|nr:ferredoxin [Actinoplanes awajinensis]KUL24113.1 ferredoxin [Actinoplanes awajinensis subsp. mycoplanecinus]
MKINVDRAVCDNHGQCVFAAPAVFSFDDDEYLVYDPEPSGDQEASVLKAIAVCPLRAISRLP